jgi:hypothetical protein
MLPTIISGADGAVLTHPDAALTVDPHMKAVLGGL